MKTRIGYIDDNKKEVFKIDLSNLSGKKLLEHVMYVIILLENVDKPINFYVDVRKCKLNVESLAYLKIVGKRMQPHVNKSGIIGVTNYIKPFFDIYTKYTNSSIKLFQSDIELKEYLGISF